MSSAAADATSFNYGSIAAPIGDSGANKFIDNVQSVGRKVNVPSGMKSVPLQNAGAGVDKLGGLFNMEREKAKTMNMKSSP